MSKGEPDQELKKAFMELQGKMQETNQKLRIADVQVESLKKQIVHAQLTDKEIQVLCDYFSFVLCIVLMCLKLVDFFVNLVSIKRKLKFVQDLCNNFAVFSELRENTRVYEGVGRMFLLTDIPMVRNNLKAKVAKCNDKIANLQSNKEYLERSMVESQNNLREMIKLKQAMSAA
ncbi:prefoldin subunit 1 [Macrobrachium rosenbergii]|uniref:prefoldin subunit 1 n=1 Tax=Macrobrachium rosenbergii TaxID=79674 RepID=UPI0034D3C37B